MEIKDKKGSENLVADHLSKLEYIMKEEDKREVEERKFPDEQLFMVNIVENSPWYVDYVNYIVAKTIPWDISSHQRSSSLKCAITTGMSPFFSSIAQMA